MAVARVCDRCGEHYIPLPVEVKGCKVNGLSLIDITYNDNSGRKFSIEKTMDLCPKCTNSLAAWIEDLTI